MSTPHKSESPAATGLHTTNIKNQADSIPETDESTKKFTQKQLLLALEIIASKIDVVCAICREQAADQGDHQSAYYFHAIDQMLESVGALADVATGAGVVGDFPTWICGTNFHESKRDGGKHGL